MTTTPPRLLPSDRLLFAHLVDRPATTNIPVPLERTAQDLGLAPRTIARSLQRLEQAGAITHTPGQRGRGNLTHVTITNPDLLQPDHAYAAASTVPQLDATGAPTPADQRRIRTALLLQAVELTISTDAFSVLLEILRQAGRRITQPIPYDLHPTVRYFDMPRIAHDEALESLVTHGFVSLTHRPTISDDAGASGPALSLTLRPPYGWEQLGPQER